MNLEDAHWHIERITQENKKMVITNEKRQAVVPVWQLGKIHYQVSPWQKSTIPHMKLLDHEF